MIYGNIYRDIKWNVTIGFQEHSVNTQIVRIAKNYFITIPDRGPNGIVNPCEISVVHDGPLLKSEIMLRYACVSFFDTKNKGVTEATPF